MQHQWPVIEVMREADAAHDKYGDFSSMHEAYGVLQEEVSELFDAIRLRQDSQVRPDMIRHEALQIAAVAIRIAEQSDRVKR